MFFLYVSLGVTGTLLFGYVIDQVLSRKLRRVVNKIPGPKTLPFLGNALFVAKYMHDRVKVLLGELPQFYGGVYRLWMFNKPYIVIGSAKYVEGILTNTKQIDKGRDCDSMRIWLGDGLILSTGRKWMERRKMVTPAFHLRTLDSLVPIFIDHADVFVNVLRDKANSQEVFNIFPVACRCTLDMICEYAMGVKLNAQLNTDSKYVSCVNSICKILVDTHIHPLKRIGVIFRFTSEYARLQKDVKHVHEFTMDVIRRRRATLEAIKSADDEPIADEKMPFLDRLIFAKENGKGLSDASIQEEVDTFMFGGHDTTATNLSFLLFFLGNNKDVQDKVYEEVIRVLGDEDGEISVPQLHEMKYLECCIKETLRLFPSVPAIFRVITEDIKAGEYTIPAGSDVVMSIFSIHRDPTQFPDPLVFNPDRFMSKDLEGRSPFAFIPFSAGRRNCVGQKFAMLEEKVIVSKLIRHFEVESLEKFEELQTLAEVVLKSRNGIRIRLKHRKVASHFGI